MAAFFGDHMFVIIGVAILIMSIGWLRKPIWKFAKRGVGFGGKDSSLERTARRPE